MKHKTIITTILFAAISLAVCGCEKEESAASHVAEAIEAGDYETAISTADSAIAAGGEDSGLCRVRGIALLGTKDAEKAVEAFIRSLSLSNGIVSQADIDTSYYLAVAQYKTGDIQGARDTVDAILGLRPKEDGAWFLRGKIDLAMGNRDEAMTDFDKTVTLAPTNYDRYVGIYEELHARGYDSDAASYLEKAISAGNKLSDYNKGVLEYYLGSYTDARNDLENAKKTAKDNENLTLYLGKTYEALGDAAYAMTLYEDHIRQNSSAGRIYEQLANCQMSKGQYEDALTTIESGLSLGQGEGMQGMMFDRVVAYERLYDFESAKKSIAEYLEMFPDDEVAKRENVFLSSR